VLYGRRDALESLPPWMGGGDMVETVTLHEATCAGLPARLEAGTPNIAGAVGLGAAVDFLRQVGLQRIAALESEVMQHLEGELAGLPWVRVIGAQAPRLGAVSFVVQGVHAHDVGTVLDRHGVAVRVGHHCAMPVMQRFAVAATVRASLSVHNTRSDIDALVAALRRAREMLA
jgi:cysteine desulfurase/selenocysteine lyase